MKNFGESSESEEETRVVKTGQDKKIEHLNLIFSDLKNHLKINDFGQIMTDFERLTTEIQRSLDNIGGVIVFEAGEKMPNNVIRAFIKIEDAINESNQAVKDKKLTLSKQNSVSLNKLKQKVKKYLSTTGPADNNYEKQLATFREKPIWSEDEVRAAKDAAKLQKAASTPSTQKKFKDAASSGSESSGSSDSSDEKTKKPKVAAKKKA